MGSAQDSEDGQIQDASLEWESSIDGLLGTGSNLDIKDLSPGVHTIQLTATDSMDKTGTASVQVTINEQSSFVDLTGTWSYQLIYKGMEGRCGEGTNESGNLTIIQSRTGFSLTIGEKTYTGTISGNTYSCSYSEVVEAGNAASTIIFSPASKIAASGTSEVAYIYSELQCVWYYDITMNK